MASNQTHRLHEGGFVDRSQPLEFKFDGKSYSDFRATRLPPPWSPMVSGW